MLDWDDLRHFLALSRAATLAQAARRLKVNATTVGRRLTALEDRVGARLFDRTPDGYALTQAGRDLLPHAERIEDQVLALERRVVGADQRLSGTVRVSVTEMIGTRFIAPYLCSFADEHPELAIDLNCTARSVNLARREADIALRLTRPHEPNLVIKKMASVHLALYASRSYLEQRGRPADPERSLAGHQVLAFAAARPFAIENDWLDKRLDGARVVLRSDSVSSIVSATAAGLGIALLPRSVADGDPTFQRLNTESEPEPRVIWQAVHAELARSPRVEAVTRFLGRVVSGEYEPLPED
ncbi:MAG: LysR family transcriptional regulator [Polyangiaceae bacterium]